MMASISPPALDLIDVRKSYGKVEAVCGVTLRVQPGEIVGLVGPNGAGKSTLFQMAAGLFNPDAGEVRVFGLGYRESPRAILARLGVVFQSRSLDLDMTVHDNLAFHGSLFGLSGSLLSARTDEVITLLGVGDLLERPVRSLSGGNQRRVEVARALLNHPDLLLLDEPTAGLDQMSRRGLVEHVRSIARNRATAVVWTSHLLDEVDSSDRVVTLTGGRIVGERLISSFNRLSGRLSDADQAGE